ncbi:hypothetical protein GP2143_17476 [marine gamma proteobacterium HTCC2143]|jgi:hypothetical protein|uniref:Uncharacterized protein n=1 Tax=marine gamma proteobacterium HTCC2143 TaxID=247633 RepID=A0YAB5_9GAMM|nr:hypothetical protein GP2143_17476 [marine gamma proteobacterium HTCC2143]
MAIGPALPVFSSVLLKANQLGFAHGDSPKMYQGHRLLILLAVAKREIFFTTV